MLVLGGLGALQLEAGGVAGAAVGRIGQVADHVHQAVALDLLLGQTEGGGAVVVDAALELLAAAAELAEHGLAGLVDRGVVVDQALGQIVADLVLVAHGADGRNPLTLGLPSGGLDLLDVDGLFHGWRT